MFDFFKKSKRQQIRDNAEQGRQGEARVKTMYEMNGYNVKRTGRGHDYRATKRNWFTGKLKTVYVEVKSGPNSKLSPLQKKKKKQYGGSYRVEHVDTNPFASLLGTSSQQRTKTRKTRKRKLSSGNTNSAYDVFFGSSRKNSSRKRRSKSSNSWGFGDNTASFW